MEKVIPRSLNYSDIKPEAIENMVKLVRFTPTATVNDAKANDIIRFQIQGNSFFDPYSSYIKIEVEVDKTDFATTAAAGSQFKGRFLDRSAHSFINRFVCKSQGTELERIEHYDIQAAMINDMCYSPEQTVHHHYEGFPHKSIDLSGQSFDAGYIGARETVGALPLQLLPNASQPLLMQNVADQGFWGMWMSAGFAGTNAMAAGTTGFTTREGATLPYKIEEVKNGAGTVVQAALAPTLVDVNNSATVTPEYLQQRRSYKYAPLTFPSNQVGGEGLGASSMTTLADTFFQYGSNVAAPYYSEMSAEFCIPIYSGIIGVLQPDRKLLPLSLMPLELEFTLNPYAFYDVGATLNPRRYLVKKFWIYTHVMTFEQELHRSLESVVAESGIFIHFNSFYLAPIATHTAQSVQNYVQINIHSKSIQSVHFVYIYGGWEADRGVRKLHFVNHNLDSLQLRNGTELIPSEPIQSKQSIYKNRNAHFQFLLETYKGWSKMHDPTTDCAIQSYNYVTDEVLIYPDNAFEMFMQQAQLGRCQYAISMEGEELGQEKQLISGRKGLIPFDINTEMATKSVSRISYQFTYAKCDFLIYVRPDLVVTLLGK